jgi:membrane fusion protein, multidrug efflux system
MPATVELPGRTSAYLVAEVRPQVGALVQKRLFVEGADVKAGNRASLNSAMAAVARAEANLASAAPNSRRYRELLDVDGVSRQEYGRN